MSGKGCLSLSNYSNLNIFYNQKIMTMTNMDCILNLHLAIHINKPNKNIAT